MHVLHFNRQRKVAVFLWGLCLLSIFLPTSRISLFMGHFYETSVVVTLLWYSLPLALIWVGERVVFRDDRLGCIIGAGNQTGVRNPIGSSWLVWVCALD